MDIIRRILTTIISGAVIAYAIYLLTTGAIVVAADHAGMNLIGLLGIIAIAGYTGVIYGIYPIYHPWQKRIFLILGIGLIFFGEQVFINNPEAKVYAADLVKIFGVLIIWFGATGLLSKSKGIQEGKKNHKHKNAEIIEA